MFKVMCKNKVPSSKKMYSLNFRKMAFFGFLLGTLSGCGGGGAVALARKTKKHIL